MLGKVVAAHWSVVPKEAGSIPGSRYSPFFPKIPPPLLERLDYSRTTEVVRGAIIEFFYSSDVLMSFLAIGTCLNPAVLNDRVFFGVGSPSYGDHEVV